tara:strand:+ start:97 stop:294 length:198 start_codon:yes stop_codon:yes gene_type:complete
MARKFKVWLDSGANIHSKRQVTISLGEIGIEDDEWDEMSEDDRDEVMKEIAFDHSDWGYAEVDAV